MNLYFDHPFGVVRQRFFALFFQCECIRHINSSDSDMWVPRVISTWKRSGFGIRLGEVGFLDGISPRLNINCRAARLSTWLHIMTMHAAECMLINSN